MTRKKRTTLLKYASIIDISSGDDDLVKLSSDEEDEDDDDDDYDDDDDADAAEPEDMNNSGSHINDAYNVSDERGRVLVNVGHPTSDPDIFLTNLVARCIKPHQIGGLRFLYDNLVECVNRFKTSQGFGCILAHSMGLGKTIQMISFVDIFLKHTGSKTVLCIVPINTLANWMAEFNMWAPDQEHIDKLGITDTEPRPYNIYLLNDYCRTTEARTKVVSAWYEMGGVLIMGYEMYRLLSGKKGHIAKTKTRKRGPDSTVIDVEEDDKNKTLLFGIQHALVNPGPDLVVCDEGHRIKNSHAGISKSLKLITTKRRVVLTGYPLQNNLVEYWCMVDFVRPNFLGTKTEFSNMFERPIMNGQCADSTPQDVRVMRYRSHVLHSLLEGFVQRRGHTVLQAALPPKDEHVLMIRMSPIQKQLYAKFMESVTEEAQNGWVNNNPLKAFSVCCKIWNHPDVLYNIMKKRLDDNDLDIDTLDSKKKGRGKTKVEPKMPPTTQAEGMDVGFGPMTPALTNFKPTEPAITYEWANEIMKDYVPGVQENSGKMVLLFSLIHEALSYGDKMLVFSQSLFTLSLVEEFLSKEKVPRPELDEYWCKNKTYFRLDGSTSSSDREKLINHFNKKNNVWLFLLSTRAGSLGVNLVGANRVIVLDASWNPCHDCQAICRVYRFGQVKPSHIYRLVTENTMERKIYDRQINKQGISDRVVDELNPQNQFRREQVDKLLTYEHKDYPLIDFRDCPEELASNESLRNVLCTQGHWVTAKPFTHESLLIDRKELKLTMKEKRLAKQSYVLEKRLNVSYSRPSYSSYYARPGQTQYQGMIRGRGFTRPIASVKPMVSTPIPMKPKIVTAPQVLKPGVSVHQVLTTTEIVLPGTNTTTEAGKSEPKKIPSGQQVLVIRTPKGVYIRTPDGKIFAVRSKPQANSSSPLDTLANTGANSTTAVASTTPATVGVSVIRPSLTMATTVIRPNLSTAVVGNKPLTIVKQGPGGLIRTVIPVTMTTKADGAMSMQGVTQGQRVSAVMDGKQIRIIKASPDNKAGVVSVSAVQNLTGSPKANTKTVISKSPSFGGGSMITKIFPKPVATVQTIKKIGMSPTNLNVNKNKPSTDKREPESTGSSKTDKTDSSWSLPPINLQAITLPNQLNTDADLADIALGKQTKIPNSGTSTGIVTPTINTNMSSVQPKFTLQTDSPPDSAMLEMTSSDSMSQNIQTSATATMTQTTKPSFQPHFSLSTRPSDIDLHELQLSGGTQFSSLGRQSATQMSKHSSITVAPITKPSNNAQVSSDLNKQPTTDLSRIGAPQMDSAMNTYNSVSNIVTSHPANLDQRLSQQKIPDQPEAQQQTLEHSMSQHSMSKPDQSQQSHLDHGQSQQSGLGHSQSQQSNMDYSWSQQSSLDHSQSEQSSLYRQSQQSNWNEGQLKQTNMDHTKPQPNIDHGQLQQQNYSQGQLPHSNFDSAQPQHRNFDHGQSKQPTFDHGQSLQTSMQQGHETRKKLEPPGRGKAQQNQHSVFSLLDQTPGNNGQNFNRPFENSGSNQNSGEQFNNNNMGVGKATNSEPGLQAHAVSSSVGSPSQVGYLDSVTSGAAGDASDLLALTGLANTQEGSSFLSELTMDTDDDDDFLPPQVFTGGDNTRNSQSSSTGFNSSSQNVTGNYNIGAMGMGNYQPPMGRNLDQMFNNSGLNYSNYGGGQFGGSYNNHPMAGMSQPGMSQPGAFAGGSMYPMPGMMQPGMYGYPAYPPYPYAAMMPPMPYYPMAPYPQYSQGGNLPMATSQPAANSTHHRVDNPQQSANKNPNEMNQM